MEKYRILGKKGEGTFSEVLKCQNIRDGTFWALKKMKHLYKSMDEVQRIREIQVLKLLNGHPNIIFLREIIFDKRTGVLSLVFELMTMNLYEYIRGRQRLLANDTVCRLMYQLFKGLEYLHRHGYFHRDIKPENILIKDDCLKLADFGSCRQSSSKPPLTEYISTRWYRAPECLLTDGYYRNEMDLWSAGCVMFEVITLRPLFPGTNEIDQIDKIHDVVGTPSAATLEKFQHRNSAVDFNFPPRRGTGFARYLTHSSSTTIDLISRLCAYDPDERLSAREALRHPYFDAMRAEYQEAREDTTTYSWDNDSRLTRARADRVVRSDSSSSASSLDDPYSSPRSTAYNSSIVHYQLFKPDFSQQKQPSNGDHRYQGPSMKKNATQNKNSGKNKVTHSNHYAKQHDPPPLYYTSLSATGANGSQYPAGISNHLTKNGPLPFLPRISGASALSNYSGNSGYASSTLKKTNYPSKNSVNYYPIMSYRAYKK